MGSGSVPPDLPDDAALLAAAGWSNVPSARLLAKDATDDFCVAIIDSNGGLGSVPYETFEFFERSPDGTWMSSGDSGPAHGLHVGWRTEHVYLCGRSSRSVVVIEHLGWRHERQTGVDGWWVFVAYEDVPGPEPTVLSR